MCTSSRSVLLTGLQTADNGMYENLDVPWMKSLSLDHPTIGHMLRKAGYYTAYKGKWHLSREFDTRSIEQFMTPNMEKYGFADNFSPGDLIGHTLGGYSYDHITAGSAINWLRTKGRPLADDGKPWCMFVSFVNPHDIMYFNTDAPGESVQDTGKLRLQPAARPSTRSTRRRGTCRSRRACASRSMRRAGRRRTASSTTSGTTSSATCRSRTRAGSASTTTTSTALRNVDRSLEALLAELQALRLAREHDRRLHLRPRRDGGRARPARQGTVRLPRDHAPAAVRGPSRRGRRPAVQGAVGPHRSRADAAVDGRREARPRGRAGGRALPGKDLSPLLTNPGTAGRCRAARRRCSPTRASPATIRASSTSPPRR